MAWPVCASRRTNAWSPGNVLVGKLVHESRHKNATVRGTDVSRLCAATGSGATHAENPPATADRKKRRRSITRSPGPRAREQRRWDGEAEGLGGLEVDDELE